MKAYTKDYSKDLNQLDAARSQLSDIIKNAEKTGKLPGADAVVVIFDAIGISSAPLKGRGFRINDSDAQRFGVHNCAFVMIRKPAPKKTAGIMLSATAHREGSYA